MRNLLLLLSIGMLYTAQAQVNEEYVDGRLVKSQFIDNIGVSTSLRSIARNDGKYYMFDVSITNGTDRTITVLPKNFKAGLNTRKGIVSVPVLTRKEYLKVKQRRENLRTGLMALAGGMAAASAGQSQSTTRSSGTVNYSSSTNGSADVRGSSYQRLGSVDYSSTTNGSASYSGQSTTRSYNGAAAYNAAQNEAAKLARFQEASANARRQWNDAYIKNNTLSPYESMSGFVNVKYKKSNLCIIQIIVDGVTFEFEWDPSEAEN